MQTEQLWHFAYKTCCCCCCSPWCAQSNYKSIYLCMSTLIGQAIIVGVGGCQMVWLLSPHRRKTSGETYLVVTAVSTQCLFSYWYGGFILISVTNPRWKIHTVCFYRSNTYIAYILNLFNHSNVTLLFYLIL